MMVPEPEHPPLSEEQLDVLRRYALFEVSRDEMLRSMGEAFEVNFAPKEDAGGVVTQRRTAHNRFPIPEPGIVVTREHISNALERKRVRLMERHRIKRVPVLRDGALIGIVTERDLVHWATILLLNDAYVFDPGDEDLIAEWLNDISLHLDAS